MVSSDENNKTFGQAQSFVPGDAPDWYLQFMEKDTKKYAATGGWGYSNFDRGLKPLTDEKMMYSCFSCHKAVEARDYIFTRYAPRSLQCPSGGRRTAAAARPAISITHQAT